MRLPLITVITVVYNGARTLEQAVSSVVRQTYSRMEYIVIDGGSEDGTLDVIRKYDSAINYWVSEKDRGIYAAMNKGIAAAHGDYIFFLGADDSFASEDIVQRVVQEMRPGIDIFSGNVWCVMEHKNVEILGSNIHARDKGKYKGGMIPHQGMFVKRDLLLRRPFDEQYKIAADYKFFLQCYGDTSITFQFSDVAVSFYSNGGCSTANQQCEMENIRIHKELGLPFAVGDPYEPFPKFLLKKLLYACSRTAYDSMRNTYLMLFKCRRHRCDNLICRWCRRWPQKGSRE